MQNDKQDPLRQAGSRQRAVWTPGGAMQLRASTGLVLAIPLADVVIRGLGFLSHVLIQEAAAVSSTLMVT